MADLSDAFCFSVNDYKSYLFLIGERKLNGLVRLCYTSNLYTIQTNGLVLSFAQISHEYEKIELIYLQIDLSQDIGTGRRYRVKRVLCNLHIVQGMFFIQNEEELFCMTQDVIFSVLDNFETISKGDCKLTSLRKSVRKKSNNIAIFYEMLFADFGEVNINVHSLEISILNGSVILKQSETTPCGVNLINYFAKGDILCYIKFLKLTKFLLSEESGATNTNINDIKLQNLLSNITSQKQLRKQSRRALNTNEHAIINECSGSKISDGEK